MPDAIIEAVTHVLKEEPDVLAVYLFGSRARGYYAKRSDYDFYIFLDRHTKDSLREDEISRKVVEATQNHPSKIHLTFQYTLIVDEDRSLLLKVSAEGKLLFSKAFLLGSYEQAGLQKYYACLWEIDEKRLKGQKIDVHRQLILRLLKGYKQKYTYDSKDKKFERYGIIDEVGVISNRQGAPGLLLILDTMFGHIQYLLQQHFGKLVILYEVYIQRENLKNLEKYRLKQELENHLRKEHQREDIYLKSFGSSDGKSLQIRYFQGNEKKRAVLKELPSGTITYLQKKYQSGMIRETFA